MADGHITVHVDPVMVAMAHALATIDAALGLPEDGCNSTARTLAEIRRLRTALHGPDGYATWQDAATAERVRRVKAEAAVAEARAVPALPSFVRRPIEQAIHAAVNPVGMSVHDGMARVASDKLAYLLAAYDRLATPSPAEQPKPAAACPCCGYADGDEIMDGDAALSGEQP